MYCPRCGEQNPEDARFCGACGALLENVPQPPKRDADSMPRLEPARDVQVREEKRHGKKKKWIVPAAVAAGVTTVAAICVIGVLAWQQSAKGRRPESGEISGQQQRAELPSADDPAADTDPPETDENRQWTDLKEYAEKALIPELGSCDLGPFTCDYVMEDGSLGQDAVHDQKGVIVYSIRDFDGDGQEELLAAVLDPDGFREDMPDASVNAVNLQMYEMNAGRVERKDTCQILTGVLGTADREDDWVFFYPSQEGIYIMGSAWQFHGMYADGTYVSASVLRYEDDRFVEYASDTGLGSDFSDADVSALTGTLENIGGFEETVERMRNDHMAYFDDSSGADVFFSIYGENPWLDDPEAAKEARDQFQQTQDPAYLGEKTVEIYPGQRLWSQKDLNAAGVSEDSQEKEDAKSHQQAASYYEHLAWLEQREQELENSATDQASLNQTSKEICEMWDDELNYVYQQLKKTMTEEEFQELKKEELEWIEYRDQQADAAAREWEGGSGMPMAVHMALSEATKARVYELAARWQNR